ncbi:MAG TPA: squalene synthase HpnC [Albitalea sp.]|uniref:squalene synthase HpnC n=1 Tax=Piscinibacter sp. TaxID=1903157 RepID=UPI002ED45C04
MSVDHYENFPVASWLCPPRLRPAVAAIYWFARTADDLADEGNAAPDRRLADLAAFKDDLGAIAAGRLASPRWSAVFEPLGHAMSRFALPLAPFHDLLSAFTQDVTTTRYADRAALLDYCGRSANPIGRLLLHLYGVADAASLSRSDAICTALQLANFWQDLSVDTSRGRLYVPLADCARHGIAADDVLAHRDSPGVRAVVEDLVHWTGSLMASGAPLVHDLPGRAGWELRLVIQGGRRILHKIERMNFATLQARPRLNALDAPVMLWRAACMRAGSTPMASKPT